MWPLAKEWQRDGGMREEVEGTAGDGVRVCVCASVVEFDVMTALSLPGHKGVS